MRRHLGTEVTDIVDGRLDPQSNPHIDQHLRECRRCRDVLETERLTKQRLMMLDAPAPGEDFTSRLLGLAATGPASGTLDDPVDALAAQSVRAELGEPGQVGQPVQARTPGSGSPSPVEVPRPPKPNLRSRMGSSPSGPGRQRRRPQRLRRASMAIGSLGLVSVGLLSLSAVSPAANRIVVPAIDMIAVLDQVGVDGASLVKIDPAWITVRSSQQ